jgi:hypothetical protein
MQQSSQIPEADNKTTISALIKGLTPGHELEEYIKSDEDHRRRVAEQNQARQGNSGMTWRPHSQNPRNINNVECPQFNQDNRPSTRGGFAPRGRGRGRGPPRITNHNSRDTCFYCVYHGREHSTETCLETKKNIARIQQENTTMGMASTMLNQLRLNFWQQQLMNPQPCSIPIHQLQQTQTSCQPSQQFYPQSQAIQTIQQP